MKSKTLFVKQNENIKWPFPEKAIHFTFWLFLVVYRVQTWKQLANFLNLTSPSPTSWAIDGKNWTQCANNVLVKENLGFVFISIDLWSTFNPSEFDWSDSTLSGIECPNAAEYLNFLSSRSLRIMLDLCQNTVIEGFCF